jgi:inorganic pyrophosphatase
MEFQHTIPAPSDSIPPVPLESDIGECPEFVMPLKSDTPIVPKMTRVLSSSSLKGILGTSKLEKTLSSGSLSSLGKSGASSNSLKDVVVEGVNEPDTLEYRIHHVALTEDQEKKVISLWHDIPLYCVDPITDQPTGNVNFVCEIPRCSRKKYEIATNEPGNPIKQDEKKGQLRAFKKGDIFFNYGCMPRTWEDPEHIAPDVGVGGDNDPLDVCEIGLRIVGVAEVRRVKVLGVLCLIDDGEADWKVICIDEEDRWAPELNDIDDVERLLPGVVDSIREWFRTYKIPDGKPANIFGLEEKAMEKSYAMKVISECHESWKQLVSQETIQQKRQLSVAKLDELDISSDVVAAEVINDTLEDTPDDEMMF